MKNGFTLVELLAVLVVLGVITLVSVPSIITTNKKSIENDYNEFKRTVENAAEIYIETHPDKKPSNQTQVSVSMLKHSGYLETGLVNPKNGEISENAYVLVSKTGNSYTYEYKEW